MRIKSHSLNIAAHKIFADDPDDDEYPTEGDVGLSDCPIGDMGDGMSDVDAR